MSIGGYDAGPRHGNPHLKSATATAAPDVEGMEDDAADDALDVTILKKALKINKVDPKVATKVVATYQKLDEADD
jgi:hypothetical protein